ncbi:MAG: dihydroorotate dehydrogenase electron transfer subunit [Actinomycetota bacterium]|nr:dihydroorotate dehydrogenase electron transfer subunit [Actinomycetota bacterium]
MLLTKGEVLGHKKYGEHYHSLTIVAPEIGEKVEPGQFVNVLCGEGSAHILRRPFSVYRVHKRGGWASTIEIVFDIRGAGTQYLSQLRAHMMVDIVGPLGRGFALPKGRAHCLLVGGGIGTAPLFFLADELRNDGHRVDVIIGARTNRMLLNPIEVRRLASVALVVTEDGSTGEEGRVTDVLDETIDRCETEIIYTCGPHRMLEAVTEIGAAHGLPVQVAVEELMACGYGVCMTCVMPLRNRKRIAARDKDREAGDEVIYARSCTEGPVFNGASVIWNGSADPVSEDQAELSTAGLAVSHGSFEYSAGEHPPPGN